jgi:ferredoxin-NADP reductase/predicted pyridoxine 5'-phosphate oxidase superfamily flavin-nucleotide-binding protein
MPYDAQTPASPFHAGEIAIQRRYGVAERIGAFAAKAVRDRLPDQHRAFYAALPLLALGTVDAQGRPWASLVAGAPGFVAAPDPRRLRIHAAPFPGDPLAENLSPGAPVGGLGLQFETRRRNRFAARVESRDERGFTLAIEQSFGNCPQYILTRAPAPRAETAPPRIERLDGIDAEAAALIRAADTFLVATNAPGDGDARLGADVSHRGGKPGFVRVGPDGELTIPDFAGNLHFNTLGNLLLDDRAGLLFADFDSGDLLLLTGRAEIDFDGPEIAAFRGAERLWRFRAEAGVRLRGALPTTCVDGESSPNSLMTGDWDEAAARLAADAARDAWRPWRVVSAKDESATIRSLTLEPADGGGAPRFEAGQHLPLRVAGPDGAVLQRSYTVSSAPEDRRVRISVKRDGAASTALHALTVGAVIEAQAPRGGFTLDVAERRPAVLLSAGVGVTPMVAMLRHAVAEGKRTQRTRPIWFLHGARTAAERAFFDEVADVAAEAPDAVRVVQLLSAPRDGDPRDADGRLDVATLKRVLPFDDHDVYLCGPAEFVQGLYDGLRDMGVRDARVFAESFGPFALVRRPDADAAPAPKAEGRAEVTFARSGKTVAWTPADGALLEHAEKAGLAPAFGCRSGFCGQCAVKASGPLKYLSIPGATPAEGEALLCQAVPRAADGGETVALTLDL